MTTSILTPDQALDQIGQLTHQEETRGGLLMVRLHGLKKMGTIFGCRTTESIIQSLCQRFRKALRPDDRLFRIGRYELGIVLYGVLNRGHAVLAASKLSHILETPLEIGQRQRRLAFSIGLSLTPEHSRDPETLLRYAELAAISARHTQVPYQLYSEIEQESGVTGWDIEGDLELALANDQLSLHYQPKICATSGRLLGAEALMRWQHPTRGNIPPDRFIPIAERIGLMPQLTWWCLNTALRERQEWGHADTELEVAINISALDLGNEGFIQAITNAIGIWNTPPDHLTLEITEGSLMADIAFSAEILKRIRRHGIQISIDDFGTGYSSLAYFKQLPADELKIDRSFIHNILDDELDRHIVSTIIRMAQHMHLNIVAEGVENAQAQQILTELGCDILQGYFLSRPLPQAQFVAWIESHEAAGSGP